MIDRHHYLGYHHPDTRQETPTNDSKTLPRYDIYPPEVTCSKSIPNRLVWCILGLFVNIFVHQFDQEMSLHYYISGRTDHPIIVLLFIISMGYAFIRAD